MKAVQAGCKLKLHHQHRLLELNSGRHATWHITPLLRRECASAGCAAPSYGLYCAKLAGLRADIVHRAEQVFRIVRLHVNAACRKGDHFDRLPTYHSQLWLGALQASANPACCASTSPQSPHQELMSWWGAGI